MVIPVDFAAAGLAAGVAFSEVACGVIGVCVVKNIVCSGVSLASRLIGGDENVEDVKVDRTVHVRPAGDNDAGYDYEVDGREYVNVDWRDADLRVKDRGF